MYGRRLAYANYKNHAALLLNAVSSLPTLRFRGFWTCWGSMSCLRGTRMMHLSHEYLSLQRRVLRVSATPGGLLRMGHARGTGRSQAAHASSTALNWLAISRTRKTARITSTLRGAALHPRTFRAPLRALQSSTKAHTCSKTALSDFAYAAIPIVATVWAAIRS